KVQADPQLLKYKDVTDLDDDVYTFIRYAPMTWKIYDKVLSASDNYKYTITDKDTVVYENTMFFVPDDIREDAKTAAIKYKEYRVKLEKLEDLHALAIKNNAGTKNDFATRIDAHYAYQKQVAYNQYMASG